MTRLWDELRVFLTGATKDANSEPPFLLKYRSSTTFILLTVCLAIFTDILFYGLVVPVMPFSLNVQAGVPEDQVQQWTAILLACYNVSLFIGSPVVGIYADHTSSRRLPLLFGLLALAGSTVLLCLGKNIALLIIGRLLQGLSAAIVWSVGLALLADTMGRNIGYSMGYVSIAMSVGLLISPVIGGAVYAAAGYYAVYYIAFGVIFCDILLRLVLIEKKVARQWIKDDDEPPVPPHGSAADQPEVSLAPETAVSGRPVRSEDKQATALPEPEDSVPIPEDRPVRTTEGGSARYPHWELIKSRRIVGALLGVVVQAGGMWVSNRTLLCAILSSFLSWYHVNKY